MQQLPPSLAGIITVTMVPSFVCGDECHEWIIWDGSKIDSSLMERYVVGPDCRWCSHVVSISQ